MDELGLNMTLEQLSFDDFFDLTYVSAAGKQLAAEEGTNNADIAKLVDWKILEFSALEMRFKLSFDNPLLVSNAPGGAKDKIKIKFVMP